MRRQRFPLFPIAALSIALAITFLAAVACGGTAPAPAEQTTPSDSGTGGSGTAATTSGTSGQTGTTSAGSGSGSSGGGAAQPAATRVPPTPRPTIAPDATPTPLPAALPTEVIANPVTKDAYPDAQWGGILRRGGYFDPAHYDLMQVSSVSNSFKQMMVLNNLLRYNPSGRRQDHHSGHCDQLGGFRGWQGLDLPAPGERPVPHRWNHGCRRRGSVVVEGD